MASSAETSKIEGTDIRQFDVMFHVIIDKDHNENGILKEISGTGGHVCGKSFNIRRGAGYCGKSGDICLAKLKEGRLHPSQNASETSLPDFREPGWLTESRSSSRK
jgi:hypothetical protein